MASSPPSRSKNSLLETIQYFAKYDYPLTSEELWFWQHFTKISKFKIRNLNSNLKFKISNWKLRKRREIISKGKWLIAHRVGESLQKIPFIEAIFVTGSLAMNNCKSDADIDLMLITSPNSLWLTRLLVYLQIHSFRRHPHVTSAPDRVCDNLYLDIKNLELRIRNLYTAHEILQAKCIFDRSNIHQQFLTANSWVKSYLPIAYSESIKKFNNLDLTSNFKFQISNLLFPINFLLFILQYLYMKPKMTNEKVSLHSAFFHPHLPS